IHRTRNGLDEALSKPCFPDSRVVRAPFARQALLQIHVRNVPAGRAESCQGCRITLLDVLPVETLFTPDGELTWQFDAGGRSTHLQIREKSGDRVIADEIPGALIWSYDQVSEPEVKKSVGEHVRPLFDRTDASRMRHQGSVVVD